MREQVDQILETYWRDNVKAREQATEPTYVRRAVEGEQVDAQALFREQARQRKKTNVDVRSLVIKTKSNTSKPTQQEQKVGQPA